MKGKSETVIKRINNRINELTPAQKKVALLIKNNTQQISYLPAVRIGELADVSEATVHRLACSLDYNSFRELQQAIQKMLLYNRTVVRLKNSSLANKNRNILEQIRQSEINNINNTLTKEQEDKIWRAAELIINAKNIYIAGWKLSMAVSKQLSYSLQIMLGNVLMLPPAGELYERLFCLKKEDLLIAVAFRRYSKQTLFAVEEASKRKVKIISITDQPDSPFVKYSDLSLFAATDSNGFLDSYVAPLIISQAITQAVSQLARERVMENLEKLEVYFNKNID